jgi:hypothetical protein
LITARRHRPSEAARARTEEDLVFGVGSYRMIEEQTVAEKQSVAIGVQAKDVNRAV